jgi:dihydroorotase
MSENQPGPVFDLVVRGGRVLDPGAGLDQIADVGVYCGRVAAIGPDLTITPHNMDFPPALGTRVVDATGCLVVPGLIDIHTHIYTGVCPLTVAADEVARSSGVTTMVSAGDAGAHTIEGFRLMTVERNRTRILAFLHVSTIGLASWPVGEAVQIDMLDVELACRAVEENRDLIVGIKVRETEPDVVGDNGLEPLRRAIEVGERTNLPVMCHIGNTPAHMTEVLEMLRPGDILTHCFTGSRNNIVVDGELVPGTREAIDRGVVFDIAHGFGSYDFDVAETAIEDGVFPTTISTDIHSLSASSASGMGDLPLTMSKILALGVPLDEVIRATTSTPASVIGRAGELGTLTVGSVADLAVIEIIDVQQEVTDSFGNCRTIDRAVRARTTIRAGHAWGEPAGHPGRTLAAAPRVASR